jgi:hypothetical protein
MLAIRRPERRLRSRLGKLTQQQWLATFVSASVHCSGGHDFRSLLRNRSAVVGAPIHRVDVDDHRLFKTRHVVRGDCANIRRRAHPCSLCHIVNTGKTTERKSDLQLFTPKIDMICTKRAFSLIQQFAYIDHVAGNFSVFQIEESPPAPPPKNFLTA